MAIHVKKSVQGIVGIDFKPYPYNKASQNYCWRIYIWSTTFPPWYNGPRYTTYHIQNVKKDGFL